MCSRSSSTDSVPQKPYVNLISDTCRKCTNKASVVLQTKFSYCRECFLEYFKHKYRVSLGKSKLMKQGDNILIGFSGSSSSVCLINLIRDCLNNTNGKRMSFNVNVLYIDESSVCIADGINQPNINEIRNLLAPYNFKSYFSDLGAFLANDLDLDANNLYNGVNNIEQIKELFLKFQTCTSKIDLLVKIRNDILFKVANKLGCQKIFNAETSDHLAINTIANIVQGRGGQLPQDIGFCDDRLKDLILVRPLQNCTKKEIAYYNVFNDLNNISPPTFCTMADKYSSIQKLTEGFINELQISFPSTVLTIRGTGSKLSAANNDNGYLECSLCQGRIDERKFSLTAHQASQISRLVSNLGPDEFDSTTLTPSQNSNASCGGSCSCAKQNCSEEVFFKELLDSSICYGCHLILKECESLQALPKVFLARLQEKSQFEKMHNEIKTFLL